MASRVSGGYPNRPRSGTPAICSKLPTMPKAASARGTSRKRYSTLPEQEDPTTDGQQKRIVRPLPCRAGHHRQRLEQCSFLSACLRVLLAQRQHRQQVCVVDRLQGKTGGRERHKPKRHGRAVLSKHLPRDAGDRDRHRAAHEQQKDRRAQLIRIPCRIGQESGRRDDGIHQDERQCESRRQMQEQQSAGRSANALSIFHALFSLRDR